MLDSKGKVQRVEEMLVGVFGAFIGGEFVVDLFRGGQSVPGVSIGAIGMALAGAIVMLALLKMMRGVVGPMRNSKSPTARRR